MPRTDAILGGLPDGVRMAIERHCGQVTAARDVNSGTAEIALVLTTSTGRAFLKGVPDSSSARIETRVQPHLPEMAPQLLWWDTADGYLLMAFAHIPGEHADLAPGSPDLPKVSAVLDDLSRWSCPELPVRPIEQRLAQFADVPLDALAGDTLMHTDLTAENILIVRRNAWIIDWAWPSYGAAWLDTASMVVRLMQAGHTPAEAQRWGLTVPAFREAPRYAVKLHARARAELARDRRHPIEDLWNQYIDHLEREA